MPTDSKNLTPEQKKRILDALTSAPTRTKDGAAVYRELNTSTRNTDEDKKHEINRTNIG
jgi:hypothetical protein